MNSYSLFHVTDTALLRGLDALDTRNATTTAELLAHLAEVDSRRLYAPAGYPSMFAYCVEARHYSEGAAFRRIRAARRARRFPEIFAAVARERVHLTAVVLLAPYLSRENVRELLEAAAHKSRKEIQRLLAERFPQPDVPTQVRTIAGRELTPASVGAREPDPVAREASSPELTPASVGAPELGPAPTPGEAASELTPASAGTPVPPPRVTPLAPERYAVQFTMGQAMHEKLEYARALLSHEMPSGSIPEILERALDALISSLEKRKFAAVAKPRKASGRRSTRARHVPAEIKNAVWKRDKGCCTFVSDSGHRCESRKFLEYDHVIPAAKGGRASLENLRLRCRAHNQLEAERVYAAGFMHEIRERVQRASLP
jgi:hypothetical protein